MNNKMSSGPDEISNQLLKLASPHIAGSLTYTFNLYIEQNVFPSEFQKTKVIPLPKTRDHKTLNAYRPISLLSVLSKLLERHVYKHLVTYLETRDLYHPLQSGFRRKHTCNTANRVQRVFIRGSYSSEGTVKYGVPQGSVLGPVLFRIYNNDLPLHIPSNSAEFHMLEDDTTLHTTRKSVVQILKTLQLCLDRITVWCNVNHMLINPVKTKSMVITSRQKQQLSSSH